MPDPKCDCLECRVRKALGFREGPQPLAPALQALGNVMAEFCAYLDEHEAALAATQILVARARWLKKPDALVKVRVGGHA